MAGRIPPEKKAEVIRLHYQGARVRHIALCLRLRTTTVQDVIQRFKKEQRTANRAAGNQDVGPSLAEIEAERNRIRDSWSEEERERRAASAYRMKPANLDAEYGGRHWNGLVW